MKKISIFLVFIIVLSFFNIVDAHSGRTDSSGGHRDNKNASGLGYYHYHHGEPPHLHPNGICPYENNNISTNNYDNLESKSDNDYTKKSDNDYTNKIVIGLLIIFVGLYIKEKIKKYRNK